MQSDYDGLKPGDIRRFLLAVEKIAAEDYKQNIERIREYGQKELDGQSVNKLEITLLRETAQETLEYISRIRHARSGKARNKTTRKRLKKLIEERLGLYGGYVTKKIGEEAYDKVYNALGLSEAKKPEPILSYTLEVLLSTLAWISYRELTTLRPDYFSGEQEYEKKKDHIRSFNHNAFILWLGFPYGNNLNRIEMMLKVCRNGMERYSERLTEEFGDGEMRILRHELDKVESNTKRRK